MAVAGIYFRNPPINRISCAKREESRELPMAEFEEAKKTLVAEIQQKTLQDYIKELRKTAKVEYVGQQTSAIVKP